MVSEWTIASGFSRKANSMSKRDVLESLVAEFASGVAEQERGLSTYFVETSVWSQLCAGHKSVILGSKGSGKSALFTLLLASPGKWPDGVLAIGAEQPITETSWFRALFMGLANDPPPGGILDQECQNLWKAYFLVLIDCTVNLPGAQLSRTH